MAKVLKQCPSMGLVHEMDQLIAKLKQEAGKADAITLEQVLMPFLQCHKSCIARTFLYSRRTIKSSVDIS